MNKNLLLQEVEQGPSRGHSFITDWSTDHHLDEKNTDNLNSERL